MRTGGRTDLAQLLAGRLRTHLLNLAKERRVTKRVALQTTEISEEESTNIRRKYTQTSVIGMFGIFTVLC